MNCKEPEQLTYRLNRFISMYLYLSFSGTDLVGVSTKQKIPYGSSDSFCSTGSTNAAVFPLPVLAQPIQSRPVTNKQSINQINKKHIKHLSFFFCFTDWIFQAINIPNSNKEILINLCLIESTYVGYFWSILRKFHCKVRVSHKKRHPFLL